MSAGEDEGKNSGRAGARIVHRGCTGNAERGRNSSQFSVSSSQFLAGARRTTPAGVGRFLWSCADGAAVIGVGDFPEDCSWIAGVDAAGVAEWDVAVDLAVNKKDRDFRRRD